ncbi:MAG: hypothetical protein WC222_11660 [Parachlamydiales bacterium]|jgi:hypothetical protein
MANQLPIVKIGRKRYYFDAKLLQIRNVTNPNDFEFLCELEVFLLAKAIDLQQGKVEPLPEYSF